MGERLRNETYLPLILVLAVASGCYKSYKAGNRDANDSGAKRDDVSRTLEVADASDNSDARGADEDSGLGDILRRDSGRRDSGRRDSGRRDSGRRDSGEYDCDSVVLDRSVPISVTGNTRGGSDQLDPTCADRGAPERTFVFRPTIAGRYQIDTFSSDFDTVLYGLEGDCRGPELFCNDDVDYSTQSYIDLWLDAGETVTIVVDGFFASDQGRFVLNITRQDSQCGNGIIETGEECDGRALGGESCDSLGFEGGRLLCRADCFYDVSMCVTGVTGGAGGSGGAGGADETGGVGGIDETGGTGGTGGTDETGGAGGTAGSAGTGGYPCDLIDLGSTVPQWVSGNTDSLPDQVEPSCVWSDGSEQRYLFQAEQEGYYSFSTKGSNFDTVLYLLDGVCVGAELSCDDDDNTLLSSLTSYLSARQLVTVVVDGFAGDHGPFILNINYGKKARVCGNGVLEIGELCEGDDFDVITCRDYGYQFGSLYCDPIDCHIDWSDCYGLSDENSDGGHGDLCESIDLGSTVPQSISGNTLDSSDNLFSNCVQNDGSEQSFTFTTARSGTYVFDTLESRFDTVLSVRRGDCSGPEVACNDDTDGLQARVSLSLQAGETVTIVVDGFDESAGIFFLNINYDG